MRDNYSISSVDVRSENVFNNISHIIVIVCFKGENDASIASIPLADLQRAGVIKTEPNNVDQVQVFFNSEKGMSWLSKFLENRDYNKIRRNFTRSIEWKLKILTIDDLSEVETLIDNMLKKKGVKSCKF